MKITFFFFFSSNTAKLFQFLSSTFQMLLDDFCYKTKDAHKSVDTWPGSYRRKKCPQADF